MKNIWLPTLFDDMFALSERNTFGTPKLNIKENDKEFVMELAVPGMTKEDCKVSIDENGYLVVSINKSQEKNEEDKQTHKYLRREFSSYAYEEKYEIPEVVDIEKISAKTEHGILVVTLPKFKKEEKALSRTITVS